MFINLRKTFSVIFFLALSSILSAQRNHCTNLDFSLGDFTNWEGYTWTNSTVSNVISTSPIKDLSLQTIMTDINAYDKNTGYALKKIPPGYTYSVRLNDTLAKTQVATLRYALNVDSTNALLLYKFAVVLKNPTSGHTRDEEPRFKITIYDEKGNIIPDCSNYDVYASDAKLSSSFNAYYRTSSSEPVLWRDWTTVGVNLLPYFGKNITIEFWASDCTHKGHYGYAYLIAECQPLRISNYFCENDVNAQLVAPDGFISYLWKDNSNDTLGTSRTLDITNPIQGAKYTCEIESATGCTVSLETKILKYFLTANFDSELRDCRTNTYQFANLSNINKGTLNYLWNFDDGTTSTDENPLHSFKTSGSHNVSLTVNSNSSLCSKTAVKAIEAFVPQTVNIRGDTVFCPNEKIRLHAENAYAYQWGKVGDSSFSSTDRSIEVGSPGGTYFLVGFSEKRDCQSDTVYHTVKEETPWILTTTPDTACCIGNSVTLRAEGAYSYLWNNQQSTNSIIVNIPGEYTVNAYSKNGCSKSKTIKFSLNPLPNATFTSNSEIVDTKNNTIQFSASPDISNRYFWDFGDGTNIEANANVSHVYRAEINDRYYTVKLRVVNKSGCESIQQKTIYVTPFIPNVFTPNGDGINDKFMDNENFYLTIYDRNSNKIFEGKGGWDGTYKGKTADEDTYFYVIEYNDPMTNNKKSSKGYIMLKK